MVLKSPIMEVPQVDVRGSKLNWISHLGDTGDKSVCWVSHGPCVLDLFLFCAYSRLMQIYATAALSTSSRSYQSVGRRISKSFRTDSLN